MPTKIEWCDETWNPITGCTPISEGCAHCYAARMAIRLAGRCGYPADDPFRPGNRRDHVLGDPFHWTRKERKIFIDSMGDLFHDDVLDWAIDEVMGVILACGEFIDIPDHKFMALTKRPENMLKYFSDSLPADLLRRWSEASPGQPFDEDLTLKDMIGANCSMLWDENGIGIKGTDGPFFSRPENVFPLKNLWLGATIENQARADERIPYLLNVPAAVRFVSIEPMLGPVTINKYTEPFIDCDHYDMGCTRPENPFAETGNPKMRPGRMSCRSEYCVFGKRGLDWAICGGETGPGARPMQPDWVRSLRDQCVDAGVPFFFKGWGTHEVGRQAAIEHGGDRMIDGVEWAEFPKGRA